MSSEPWKSYYGPAGFMQKKGTMRVTREQLVDFYTNYADAAHKVEKITTSLLTYKDKDSALVKALCEKYPDSRGFWEETVATNVEDPATTELGNTSTSFGKSGYGESFSNSVSYSDTETVMWMKGSACHPFVDNARKLISFLWILTNLLVVCFVCSAIAVAAADDCSSFKHCSHAFGFYAIYVMFIAIILCIAGTRVMRRHRNSFFVGVFLGVSGMMSLNMLASVFLFASDAHGSAGVAAAIFAFLLFVSYGVFTISLLIHRNAIIKSPQNETIDDTFAGEHIAEDHGIAQTPQTSV